MNAKIAGCVGILRLKPSDIINIEMFRHPKYYKELRKLRNNSDQAISSEAGDGKRERATGPGHKLQAREDSTAKRVAEPQASSVKPQAPEASSGKHQAPSSKRQA